MQIRCQSRHATQINKYFDIDTNNVISRTEYESKDALIASIRAKAFRNAPFSVLDVNKDSTITATDFGLLNKSRYEQIVEAFNTGDDDWIWNNYFRVTTQWYNEHKNLEPNRTALLKLDIPIYIFQGLEDGNAPAEGTYDIQKRFAEAGKTNLHCYFFKGHNHDLNYTEWPFKKTISPGLTKIFEVADSLQ